MKRNSPLSANRQIKIAKFVAENPSVSLAEVSRQFGVGYEQVRGAVRRYAKGELVPTARRGRTSQRKMKEARELSSDTIIKTQFNKCLEQLHSDVDLPVEKRIDLLKDLIGMRRTVQIINLQANIKELDGDILVAVIHRFAPQMDVDEIAKIYDEELERCRSQKSRK